VSETTSTLWMLLLVTCERWSASKNSALSKSTLVLARAQAFWNWRTLSQEQVEKKSLSCLPHDEMEILPVATLVLIWPSKSWGGGRREI
jgi:hypothetical protein